MATRIPSLILASLVLAFVLSLFTGWIVMLLLGAAHSQDAVIPALSYWGSYFLTVAVGVATSSKVSSS